MHAIQAARTAKNYVVSDTPRTKCPWSIEITDDLGGATSHGNAPQLPTSHESYLPAIRRKERAVWFESFGAERNWFCSIERLNEQPDGVRRIDAGIGNHRAIGRDGGRGVGPE